MKNFEELSINDVNESVTEIGKEEEILNNNDRFQLKALMDLSTSLKENPHLENQIKEIFEYHLRGDISSVDTRGCLDALEFFISSDSAYLLLICCLNNSPKYLQRIENIASQNLTDSESVIRLLKLVTALYGTKIEVAHYKNSHDWKWISPELYTNSNNDYSLEIEIIKFNNENIFLKMDLSSTLNFTEKLIEELSQVPKEIFNKKIDEETREVIINFYEKFFS